MTAANPRGAPTDAQCAHLPAPDDVPPSSDGCVECLREGLRDWFHLRECLECGHVACCDNSPRRHATAHWHATEHPLMRSFQPGESWGWCYPDKLFLVPRAA